MMPYPPTPEGGYNSSLNPRRGLQLTLQVFGIVFLILISLISLAQEYNNSIRVKLSFDSSQVTIGTLGAGILQDNNKEIKLHSLNKYKLKFNAHGEYSLFLIKNKKEQFINTVSLPFNILSTQKEGIFFEKNWYRGKITLKKNISGIIAVNSVSSEYLLNSVIARLSTPHTSREAIKAGSILLRSSLHCLRLDRGKLPDYDISDMYLDYRGMNSERQPITQLLNKISGDVLVNQHGELACTPLRSAVTAGAYPFELIGYKTSAWEKIYTFDELKKTLNYSAYNIQDIINIERRIIQDKIIIAITTTQGTIELDNNKTKELLGLPSKHFKIYNLQDKKNNTVKIQFLGQMAGYNNKTKQYNSILNLIDSLEDSRDYAGQDYEELLQSLYPNTYIVQL